MKTQMNATETIKTSTLADVIYVFAHWENNWERRDFEEAFQASPVGWEWLWEKFEVSEQKPYSFYLMLDHQHQCMLVQYLYEGKYKGEIDNYKVTRAVFRKLTGEGE